MATWTYDAGALIQLDRMQPGMLDRFADVNAGRDQVTIPTVALAQAWRGGPQAALSRLIAVSRIEAFTERFAKRVGAALRTTGTSDIVDVAVALSASDRNDKVLTSDPDDLEVICAALRLDLEIVAI